jgi:hypothetical protein
MVNVYALIKCSPRYHSFHSIEKLYFVSEAYTQVDQVYALHKQVYHQQIVLIKKLKHACCTICELSIVRNDTTTLSSVFNL